MCGIWAASVLDETVAGSDLRKAAMAADRRGSHAWGYAVVDAAGLMRIERHVGGYLGTVIEPGRWVIGNHRLATSGMTQDWKTLENNQPVQHSGVAVSHNGVVRNVDQVKYPCDSLFIAERIGTETGDLLERTEKAFAVIRSDGPHAAAVASPEGVVLFRQGAVGIAPHPLWLHARPWGVLASSRTLDQTAYPAPIGASWLR